MSNAINPEPDPLSSSIKFVAACALPLLFVASEGELGPCNLLLRRPAAYCWGLATHLFYRKKIAKEAQQAFRTKDEYINSKCNCENMAQDRLASMQQEYARMTKPYQRMEWLSPSVATLYNYNAYRADLRIHATICQALPSLPVKHDE